MEPALSAVIRHDPRTEGAERDLHLREIIEKTTLYLANLFRRRGAC
jgi:hypothetical protein